MREPTWALGFTNPMAGPILVGKLGWEDVCSLRIWVRPKRLRKRGEGGFRAPASCPPFEARHEASFGDAHYFVHDVAYLDWRYAQSPREYLRVDGDRGWAVVTHAVWHGFSSAVICDAAGRRPAAAPAPVRRRRRRGPRGGDGRIPGEERSYLAAGFVPTPRTIRFIGKRLTDDAPRLPKRREAWRFSLGDMDFF